MTPMAIKQLKGEVEELYRIRAQVERELTKKLADIDRKIAVLTEAITIVAPASALGEIKTTFSPLEVRRPRLFTQKPQRLVISLLKQSQYIKQIQNTPKTESYVQPLM